MNFLNLPIEIQDYIFLLCDPDTIKITRKYQSKYIKSKRMYLKINKAIKHGTIDNIIWLLNNGTKFNKESLCVALKRRHIQIIKFLITYHCQKGWNCFSVLV